MRNALLAVLVLASPFPGARADARGPSTAEERARAVALTRSLEREPLAEGAPAARAWLQEWIVEIPDLHIQTCPELLGPGLAEEIDQQRMFSAAAFAIEHRDRAGDRLGQLEAGVEGALRAYEALLAARPEARRAVLDELIARRARGELHARVAELAQRNCKHSRLELGATILGTGCGLVLALVVGRIARRRARAPGRARVYRAVVFGGAAYYLAAIAALHVLEPEFGVRYSYLSEYVIGRYGWLMTTTFFVLGATTFAAAAGLRAIHPPSRSVAFGFGLLVVGGVFVCLAGVFRYGLPHLAASVVALPSLALAALVWSIRSRRVLDLLVAAGIVVALSMALARVGLPGLEQRIFLSLLLVWLAINGAWRPEGLPATQ